MRHNMLPYDKYGVSTLQMYAHGPEKPWTMENSETVRTRDVHGKQTRDVDANGET